jgi:hypothetical protein
LIDFFYRYDQAERPAQGHNSSICIATLADAQKALCTDCTFLTSQKLFVVTAPHQGCISECSDYIIKPPAVWLCKAAHIVLQTMSSESTPVLCSAIASFELLMTKWEWVGKEHLELQYWMQIGLCWVQKYYK